VASIERFVAQRMTSHRLAALGLIGIGLLLGPGLAVLAGAEPVAAFDYNGERNIPAAFSALLLLVAAGAAALWSFGPAPRTAGRTAGRLLAGVFGFMAVDEIGQLHEKLERIIGVDWQVLYLPVVAVAGVAAVLAAIACRDIRLRLYFLGGAMAWGLASLMEMAEYDAHDRRVQGFTVMVFTEENLEMLGSLFFAVAMMLAFEVARAAIGASVPSPASGSALAVLSPNPDLVTGHAPMRAPRRDVDWP
jgi:hypothetical protein